MKKEITTITSFSARVEKDRTLHIMNTFSFFITEHPLLLKEFCLFVCLFVFVLEVLFAITESTMVKNCAVRKGSFIRISHLFSMEEFSFRNIM